MVPDELAIATIRQTWPYNADYLDELQERLTVANPIPLVPFVGAGLSMPMGFPSWSGFLQRLADECGTSDEVQTLLANSKYEEAAETVEQALSAVVFDRRLAETFGRRRSTACVLQGAVLAIPALAAGAVVTTNFDHILERVFEESGSKFERIVWGSQVSSIRSAIDVNKPFLLKIHGDAEERSARVLTKGEYDTQYRAGDPSGLRPQLERIFQSRTLLFSGCSLVSDRTMAVLFELNKQVPGHQHFAILEKPTSESNLFEKQRWLGERSILPVWYPAGQHGLIQPLLRWIANLKPSARGQGSKRKTKTSPPPFNSDRRLFSISKSNHRVPYIALVDPKEGLSHRKVRIARRMAPFELDGPINDVKLKQRFENRASCRLERHDYRSENDSLLLTFSRTTYSDYLKSAVYLDKPFPEDFSRTYRDFLVSNLKEQEIGAFPLSNITGTGLFIVTKDDEVVISCHSPRSHVYPNYLTFSASGTMSWGVQPNPFLEVARKAFTELGHQVGIDNLELAGLGIDAHKLYVEVLFTEHSEATAKEILDIAHSVRKNVTAPSNVFTVPLKLDRLVPRLIQEKWEPAAEAALLLLCARTFTDEEISSAINKERERWQREMTEEWNRRGRKPGMLPVMSDRYLPDPSSPPSVGDLESLNIASEEYIKAALKFMGSDIEGQEILEIGCGNGRMTRVLAERASHVTAIESCDEMLQEARRAIGPLAHKVEIIKCFAQDYSSPFSKHKVCITSLVLIHNVTEVYFRSLVNVIAENCEVAFVFEDVTQGRTTSRYTRLRTEDDLRDAFEQAGMTVEKHQEYFLYKDRIVFLKLRRGALRKS
jgi:predicted RNA methylase